MPGQMFLRTALTEQRIEDLERQMARVMDHLGLGSNGEQPSEPGTEADPLPVLKPDDPDSEWEAAKPQPIEWKEPDPSEPPKQSKIAQKVAKRR